MHDILVVTYNRDKKILKATVRDEKGAFILVNRFKEEEAEKLWKILNGESQKKTSLIDQDFIMNRFCKVE